MHEDSLRDRVLTRDREVRNGLGNAAVTGVNAAEMPSGDWGRPGREVEDRATLLWGKFAGRSQRSRQAELAGCYLERGLFDFDAFSREEGNDTVEWDIPGIGNLSILLLIPIENP